MLQDNNDNLIYSDDDLLKIFYSGIKPEKNIGVEYEKLLVNESDKRPANYNQVVSILRDFENIDYNPVYSDNNLIGLIQKYGHISLEPGCQIEFSSIPLNSLMEIKNIFANYLSNLRRFAENYNLKVLDIGALPNTTWEEINVIPKERYYHMTQYLPKKNLEPFRMMRETAGIQVNLDYNSEEDAINKLSLSLKLSPIVSGMYSNSPFRNGKFTGLKSNRAYAWLNVDEERCGFISEKLLSRNVDFSFNDYKDILFDIPMIFISRNNMTHHYENTFKYFLNNGYNGLKANFDDWEMHLSLFFPEVRLKNHIEIRNHDSQTDDLALSIPTFWKGILYFEDAMREVQSLLNRFDVEDYVELRYKTPIFGIDYKIKGLSLKDISKELIYISKYNLDNQEKLFLEPIEELVQYGLTPADIILKNQLTIV